MVVVIFRSRLRSEFAEEFQELADEMLSLARGMPGFLSYTSFLSSDQERCSVIEFESHEHLRAWREHPRHAAAQSAGRERYYTEYSLQVCEPVRNSRFVLET
jgi:heme-degrading monooxygenase HmoA